MVWGFLFLFLVIPFLFAVYIEHASQKYINDVRSRGCTCTDIGYWAISVTRGCPVHGGWLND